MFSPQQHCDRDWALYRSELDRYVSTLLDVSPRHVEGMHAHEGGIKGIVVGERKLWGREEIKHM